MQKWNILNLHQILIYAVCVCVWLLWGVWCLWVIMALTPFPFIPGLLATASGRRNHMMGPFYLSEQFYPPFLIFPSLRYNIHSKFSSKLFSCFDKFTGSLALTRKNWGRVGTFDLILLCDGWVGIGFDTYLSPCYYTMHWFELVSRDI